MPDPNDELRAAFDAGVDAGERGFGGQPEELDMEFAVHLKHRAIAARKRAGVEPVILTAEQLNEMVQNALAGRTKPEGGQS